MSQSSPETSSQYPWRWQPGQSGNPRGPLSARERAERIDALAREFAEGTFDRLSAPDRELLIQAATLKLAPRRRGEDAVRRVNTISRLLNRVRRSTPPAQSLDEVLP
jgi:hypothetical protein